jgi:hypothetical protein
MKLYKLTTEYTIVVAAEDDSTVSTVENNAVHYMMQGADDIVSHVPDNVLAEEIKSIDDIPEHWSCEALPFVPPGYSQENEEITIKQILEQNGQFDSTSVTYSLHVWRNAIGSPEKYTRFKTFKEAFDRMRAANANLGLINTSTVYRIMKEFPEGHSVQIAELTSKELGHGNV